MKTAQKITAIFLLFLYVVIAKAEETETNFVFLPAFENLQGETDKNWKSGIQAQNAGELNVTIGLIAYDSAGEPRVCDSATALTPPGQSVNFLTWIHCAPHPFPLVSGVLNAAGQTMTSIVTVTNSIPTSNNDDTAFAGATYRGMSEDMVSTMLFFPLVKHNHNGRTTLFSVQNSSGTATEITAEFKVNGQEFSRSYTDIPPFTSIIISPADASVPAGRGQVGSLIVTGTQPLAGASLELEITTPQAENLQASTAFVSADFDKTLYCPLIRNGHTSKKLTTGVQVQNVSTTTQTVTYTYTPVGGGAQVISSKSIEPGASATYYAPDEGIPEGSLGAVILEGSDDIAAVVNEKGVMPDGREIQTTYACFGKMATTKKIMIPLYKEFYNGNTSGIQVQNVSGDGSTAKIALEYYPSGPDSNSGYAMFSHKAPVLDGASITFWGVSILNEGSDLYTIGGDPDSLLGTYGSVVIQSDQPIVAIANESTYGLFGDASNHDSKNYEGFNLPVDNGQDYPEQLVFVSDRDGNSEIYVMQSDGSNQVRLTRNTAEDYAPAYSSDGNKLVFNSDIDGDMELYIMNHDGSNVTKLTDNEKFDCCASWSPSNLQLVYNANGVNGPQDIFLIDADGTGIKNLTNHPGEDWAPVWSPDGTKIAFYSSRSGQTEIYVMNLDGSELHNLTKHPADDWKPEWSPDGKQIAFVSNRDGNSEIYIMNADGSDQQNLTNHPQEDNSPGWSPDGLKISFTTDRDGLEEIYIMDADGSNQTRVTNNEFTDSGSSWRP
jgi:WD40 repeat protein